MNVAHEVKEPRQRDCPLIRRYLAFDDSPVLRQCRENIVRVRWQWFDVFRLACRLEGKIDVMPRWMAFGAVAGADVIGPPCHEHEQHLSALGFRQLLDIVPPAIGVPRMFFQQCLYYRNSPWASTFKTPVCNRTGHHVSGSVPGNDLQRHGGYSGQDDGN